jgi:hypothetical protein
LNQHSESHEASTTILTPIEIPGSYEDLENVEEDPNVPKDSTQEDFGSHAPEESNPAIHNPERVGSPTSNTDSSTNNLKKHGLLRPRDVDILCDQRHRPGGLVAGFIGHRSVSLLIGDSGLGKSPLAYQLGICVSEGIPFLGMATEPGRVVYADYENGLEESRDLRNSLVQFLNLQKSPDNFLIWTPDCGDTLSLEGICQDNKPSLLIVDSLRAHNPFFESKDVAGKEMSSLRTIAYKHSVAILLVHHVRKPGQEGVENLEDDDTGLMIWLNQAAGHRSIINQSDTRVATDLSRRVADAAMVIRWHRRIHGEGGPVYIERALNEEGDPIGYKPLTGPRLLGNPEQEGAFIRLPERFAFREAKAIYARADDPTRKWLLKCISAGLVKQVAKGVYQRTWTPPAS